MRSRTPGPAPRILLTVVLLLATTAPAAADLARVRPDRVGMSAARIERIERVLRDHVESGRLPGAVGLIARRGRVVWHEAFGWRDREAQAPMPRDAIFRIASMSKPITSVAVMLLVEEGRLRVSDPVSLHLPGLGALPVAVESRDPATGEPRVERVPAVRDMTIQDLLRHTSGLTYGFFDDAWVDRQYLDLGVFTRDRVLADTVTKLGRIPLKHQPGTVWTYGVSTDVLGRLVEVASGMSFDRFLRERLFEPLGMRDTAFNLPPAKLPRVAALYETGGGGVARTELGDSQDLATPATYLSGGGGLVSTAQDYARFAQMLLADGELEGTRVLGRKTVELMRSDHLGDLPGLGRPGYGFGLGFAVRTSPGLAGHPGSVGEYHWGGAYGTTFWIDPAEELVAVLMIQLRPVNHPYRDEFRGLVYQAIVD